MQFTVHAQETDRPNRGFWRAIGYDFMFKLTHEPEGQYLLDRARKHGTIQYIRSHFTFNNQDATADKKAGGNVCGQVMSFGTDGTVSYDFSRVNRTFQEYVKRGMKPIVEFDFFPDGMCYDEQEAANDEGFSIKSGLIKDWGLWRQLLERFMQNLEATFGKEELRTWYFEVWNEPDVWEGEHQQQLFHLYDVFADVVKSHDSGYRIGGPACYNFYALKDFLDHITQGVNFVTGEVGSPIDFISHHIYGVSGNWLAQGPEIVPQVNRFSSEVLWWYRLLRRYPSLSHVEHHLNEWGVCSHGDTKFVDQFPQLEYRNSEYSALFLVKLVDCLKSIEEAYGFRTDLLLYWGACWNAGIPNMFLGSRDLTTTGNVPKPILTGWEMLSRLGEDFLKVDGPRCGGRLGLLAAANAQGCQLLAYNFNETDDDPGREDDVTIELDQLKAGRSYEVRETRLDKDHHNTYRQWQRLGSEVNPGRELLATLMRTAELDADAVLSANSDESGRLKLSRGIPRHGLLLLEISERVSA